MFKGKPFWQIVKSGGLTMYILLLCSVVSLAIIVERVLYYKRRSKIKRADFMANIRRELAKGDTQEALQVCRKTDTPFSEVVSVGLTLHGHEEAAISNSMERGDNHRNN